jgi:hypothetical protein
MRPARDGTLNDGKFTRANSLTPLVVPLLLEARDGPGALRHGGDAPRAVQARPGGNPLTAQELPRHVQRELANLRNQWRLWHRGGPHPAYSLICPARCGDCVACAATAYRADRCAEIQAWAAALQAAS